MITKTDILINEVLVKKVGLTKTQAKWVVKLSEKHAIWIANQIKSYPEIYPKATAEIKKILDWKKKNEGISIKDYDYATALEAVEGESKSHFLKQQGSLENKNVVAVCHGTPYKWVELKTKDDCIEEGIAMRHCLKDNGGHGYKNVNTRLFSLRNQYNRPVLTIQIHKGNKLEVGKIGQYSGKCNNPPAQEYNSCFKFLEEQANLKISASSKIANRIDSDLDIVACHEVLDDITGDYENGDISREVGDRKILHLIDQAKKSKVEFNISPSILDDYHQPEEQVSLEYDDNGSIIC
jgi:hypothetical protein